MRAIDSSIEIILLDYNLTNSGRIEHLLKEAQVRVSQINKFQTIEKVRQFLKHHRPDLFFFVVNEKETSNLDSLFELQEFALSRVPLVPILSQDFDIDLLPDNVANYLTWEELSVSSLKKTIWLTLKQHQRYERALIQQENTELSSQLMATKDLFREIVDNTSTLIWMCNEQGNSTFFNQAWSRILGLSNVTVANSDWMINIHPLDLPKCLQQFKQALATARGFTISYRLQSGDRQYRWISNYAVARFTLDGKFQGLIGYCFDITAHKETERQLIQRAASDRLLAQITQKIHASLELEQILQTTVVELNQFLLAEKIQIDTVDEDFQLTLLFESKLIGQTFRCDVSESQQVPQALFQSNIARLSAGEIVECHENPDITQNVSSILLVPIICEQKLYGILSIEQYSGSRQWMSEEKALLQRIALELSVAIVQAKLYQQLEKANQELEQLSIVDGLTRIANRRKFDQYTAAEWKRLTREQSPLSLILCDIDYFKLYNDTYGHQSGDRCLQKVAEAISRVIQRPADLVARYGGEEFAIVLPNTPLKGAVYLAQQVRWRIQALKIPHIASPVDLYLTLSLGVSCCIPHHNLDLGKLIAAADRGLYRAKELGRNQVVECKTEPDSMSNEQ